MKRLTDLLKEAVGDLQKDTHTVSGLAFRILSGSVLQMLYDLKRACYGGMTLPALDIYNSADTAVVVLKASRGTAPVVIRLVFSWPVSSLSLFM